MATKHYHNHFKFSYTTSFKKHFTILIAVNIIITLLTLIIVHNISPQNGINLNQISPLTIIVASANTLLRLSIAYFISLLISIPMALIITHSEKMEKILLPTADIIQSIPVLAFFPVIVLAFVRIQLFDGAAIFILFMAMIWNMVFTMIGGLKTIPQDVKDASTIFGAKGLKKTVYFTIPAIFPSIITGSFLAWAQGWNIIIVAEAIHSFIPNGRSSQDLLGLGSLLVNSFSESKTSVFIVSIVVMILIIAFFNFFIWQKLLHLAERFKFD